MHLVLFSCIGFWKVGPGGCFASFLSTKCMNNWIVECHWKIPYCYVFPSNQNSPNGSTWMYSNKWCNKCTTSLPWQCRPQHHWVGRRRSWDGGGCRRCGGRSEESVDGVQGTALLWWIILSLEQLRWAVWRQGCSRTRHTSSISSGSLIAAPIDDVKWM